MIKAENMIKFSDEIHSRPKRTWFISEKQKEEIKGYFNFYIIYYTCL
jgi:hypothetical protein